jgi:hypothetical protein
MICSEIHQTRGLPVTNPRSGPGPLSMLVQLLDLPPAATSHLYQLPNGEGHLCAKETRHVVFLCLQRFFGAAFCFVHSQYCYLQQIYL